MSEMKCMLLFSAVILALLLGFASKQYTQRDLTSRLDHLPIQGTGYRGHDVPLTAGEQSIFGDARVIKRIYRLGKLSFVFLAIDGSRYRHAVHDPAYCFRGMGWEVEKRSPIPFEGGEAALLSLAQEERHRTALFWFSDGAHRHSSIIHYWFQATARRLTFGLLGTEPLFIILQPMGSYPPSWYQVIHYFGPLHDL